MTEFYDGQKVNDSDVRDEKPLDAGSPFLPWTFEDPTWIPALMGYRYTIFKSTQHTLGLLVLKRDLDHGAVAAFFSRAVNSHADLQRLAKLGESLGKWAAAIHWSPYETNTQHWLDGLRERIEAFQTAYDALAKAEEKHKQ